MQAFKKSGFLIILCVLLLATSILINCSLQKEGSLIKQIDESRQPIFTEQDNSIDVVILGDSLSNTAISPMQIWEEYGYSSYMCGMPGQIIQASYQMLQGVFEKQSPQLVILEINSMFRWSWKENLETWENYNIPIFRFHDIWKYAISKEPINKETRDSYKGYIFRCDSEPYLGGDYMDYSEEKEKVSMVVYFYTEKIRELCEKKGAQLMLLASPSPANYNYRRYNTASEYAQDKSLDYLDMNLLLDDMNIDWQTDSLDQGDHLNLSGTRKVTAYLGEYLSEHYQLSDHRGEPKYSSWNTDLEMYKKEEENNLVQMGLK